MKSINLLIVIFVILMFTACTNLANIEKANENINTEDYVKPSVNPIVGIDNIKSILSSGKICDNFNFTIGDSLNKAKQEIGEPIREGYFKGGIYAEYKSLWIFYNQFIESKEITSIAFMAGSRFFDIDVGKSTKDDVIDLLGNTKDIYKGEWVDDEDESQQNIIKDNAINMMYEFELYYVEVYYVDNIVNTIYIYPKKQSN